MNPMDCLAGLLIGLAAGLAQAQGYPAAGEGIAGTVHDRNAHRPGAQDHVCSMCHTPRSMALPRPPRWGGGTPVYGVYAAFNLDEAGRRPGPASRVCLSCHDGTVGSTDYSGAMGRFKHQEVVAIEKATAESSGHPFGVAYDSDLSRRDPSMFDPETHPVIIGSTKIRVGTVASQMLVLGRLECTSCHDVHNRYTVGVSNKGLTRVSMVGSRLCLECHAK